MPAANTETEFLEEWLPVTDYESWYEVSNLGRVRSLSRILKVKSKNQSREFDCIRKFPGMLLCPRLNRYGYLMVHLYKPGQKSRLFTVHKLVAEAFIGPCPPAHTVDHIDGNKLNNVIGNLGYVTAKEQMRRARMLGFSGHLDWPAGEKHPHAKLSDVQIMEIRRLYAEGFTQRELARQFGVGQTHISRITNRKRRIT